jgi:hypothetical protein
MSCGRLLLPQAVLLIATTILTFPNPASALQLTMHRHRSLSSSSSALSATKILSRSRWLSSSAAAFLASTALVFGAPEPEECLAAGTPSTSNFQDNPRYIDREMEMQYGENSGTVIRQGSFMQIFCLAFGLTRRLILSFLFAWEYIHTYFVWQTAILARVECWYVALPAIVRRTNFQSDPCHSSRSGQ